MALSVAEEVAPGGLWVRMAVCVVEQVKGEAEAVRAWLRGLPPLRCRKCSLLKGRRLVGRAARQGATFGWR